MTIRIELSPADLDAIRRQWPAVDHGNQPCVCWRCAIAVLLAEVERLRAERAEKEQP